MDKLNCPYCKGPTIDYGIFNNILKPTESSRVHVHVCRPCGVEINKQMGTELQDTQLAIEIGPTICPCCREFIRWESDYDDFDDDIEDPCIRSVWRCDPCSIEVVKTFYIGPDHALRRLEGTQDDENHTGY